MGMYWAGGFQTDKSRAVYHGSVNRTSQLGRMADGTRNRVCALVACCPNMFDGCPSLLMSVPVYLYRVLYLCQCLCQCLYLLPVMNMPGTRRTREGREDL